MSTKILIFILILLMPGCRVRPAEDEPCWFVVEAKYTPVDHPSASYLIIITCRDIGPFDSLWVSAPSDKWDVDDTLILTEIF